MADIDISVGELPEAEYFDGESILLVENQGIAERVSGAQIKGFLRSGNSAGGGVASVEPAEDDIPKVFFGGPLQQTKDEAVVPFRYISKTEDVSGYAEIKAQGNSSMNYPKKNQTVKLYKDADCTEKLKVDFKGWGKQNKHVYKANWIDLTHARNVVSARLWADVVKSRADYSLYPELLRTSPNQGAVDGFPVKVYADGVYQGRYTLNIPKDAWMANMDDELDAHCILCGENYVSGCFRATANINGSDWSDEIHDTVPTSIKTRWNEIISFVMSSTDEEFKANLGNYFYVDSLLDYYLFGLASCGLDAFGKNQLYMTYDGQKWFATMYDMDSTWGLFYNGQRFVATDYGRDQYEDYTSTESNGDGNLLYVRLEELFVDEIKARWVELKAGVLSVDNIINHFERFTDIAPIDLVKEDYASTTGGGKFTGIPSKDANNIQQIRAFALARQGWADEYVASLAGGAVDPDEPGEPDVPESIPCTGITLSASTLTFTEAGSQTLTATVKPTNTTDSVVWSVSPAGIAVVNGGVVTAVANGACTVTATCGDQSATCAVSVSMEVPDIPQDGLLYSTFNRTLNGTGVIDTGVKLLEEDKDYSIIVDVTPGVQKDGSATLFHCMREISPYPGIVFRISKNKDVYDFAAADLMISFAGISKTTTERFRAIISHRAGFGIDVLTKAPDGTLAAYKIKGAFSGVAQSLVIGGYQTTAGDTGRYWVGNVHAFCIYDRPLSDEEVDMLFGATAHGSVVWSDSPAYNYDASGALVSGGNYVSTEPIEVPANTYITLENVGGASYHFLTIIEYDESMNVVKRTENIGAIANLPNQRVKTQPTTKYVHVTAYPNNVATNNDPASQLALWWLT